MFKNMKLGAKIGLGFAVILIMMAGIAAYLFVVTKGVQKGAVRAKEESVVFAVIAQQMKLDTVHVQQWLSNVSATHAQDGFNEAEKNCQSFLTGVSKFKKMYEKENNSAAYRLCSGGHCNAKYNKITSRVYQCQLKQR